MKDNAARLAALRRELESLLAEVYPGREKVAVFGEGDPSARIMLVGEAPGREETLAQKPFVGKAGKNLDEFLALAELDRGGLYVTNTVKLRPTKVSAAGNTVNRPPTREEVKLFLPWLEREIGIVNPEVVVTLGNVPLKALTGNKSIIGDMHGAFTQLESGRKLYPIYHPASLIYNRSLTDTYREDLERLKVWLDGEKEKK